MPPKKGTKRALVESDEECEIKMPARGGKNGKAAASAAASSSPTMQLCNEVDPRVAPYVREFLESLQGPPFLVKVSYGNADGTVRNARVVPTYKVLEEFGFKWYLVHTTSVTRARFAALIEANIVPRHADGKPVEPGDVPEQAAAGSAASKRKKGRSIRDENARVLELHSPNDFAYVKVRGEKAGSFYTLEPPAQQLVVWQGDKESYLKDRAECSARHKQERMEFFCQNPFPRLVDMRRAIKGWIQRGLITDPRVLGSWIQYAPEDWCRKAAAELAMPPIPANAVVADKVEGGSMSVKEEEVVHTVKVDEDGLWMLT